MTVNEFNQLKKQLEDAAYALSITRGALEDTQNELRETNTTLDNTQSELTKTQTQLDDTQSDLTETKTQLRDSQNELARIQKLLPQENQTSSISPTTSSPTTSTKTTPSGPSLARVLSDLKRAQDVRSQNRPLGDQQVKTTIDKYVGIEAHFTDRISSISESGVTLKPPSYIASNATCMVSKDQFAKLLTLRNGEQLYVSGRITSIDEGFFGGFTIFIANCTIHWK